MKTGGWFVRAKAQRSNSNDRKQSGEDAERIAENFLLANGLTLVARNYRCRFGEIDLIMLERGTLVFVEVRLRRNSRGHGVGDGDKHDFGGAAASITGNKQARIIAAAQHYLAGMKHLPPCRFDAVLMSGTHLAGIEWMRGAFEA